MFKRFFTLAYHAVWYLPLILFRRATFSDLIASMGVFYIKLAQMMSTRPDLFPSELILSLRDLQDKVPPTLNLGDCLASGSIAEVYDLGDRVVKVKRQNVDRYIEVDYQLTTSCVKMKPVQWLIGHIWGEAMLEGLNKILGLIRSTISQHLDFKREASTMNRFRELLSDNHRVVIPEIYQSNDNSIIMEKINGVHLDQVPSEERYEILDSFLRLVHEMIFTHHLVHGDLHEGNFLIDNGKIGLLDFGLAHEVTSEQTTLLEIFLEAISRPCPEDLKIMASLMYQKEESSGYEDFKNDIICLFQSEKESLYSFLNQLAAIFKRHQVDFEESLLTPILLMVTAEGISKKHGGPDFLSVIHSI